MKRNCVSTRGIAYIDVGDGPCILLIHAFGFDADMWEPQLSHMQAAGYRVIAPDVRGFGESPSPSVSHGFTETVDDVVGVLDDAGIGRAVVGGLSMGAAATMAIAVAYPDRVAGLFIADNSLPDGIERATAASDRIRAVGLTNLADIYEPILFGQRYRTDQPAAIAEWRRRLIARDKEQLATVVLAYHNRKNPFLHMKDITVPATVVFGEEDVAVPEGRRSDYGSIPGVEMRRIPHAGHMSNLEQPEAFSACLANLADKAFPDHVTTRSGAIP